VAMAAAAKRSGGARRQPRCQMAARSSLCGDQRPAPSRAPHPSAVVAALALSSPAVRLASPGHSDGLLDHAAERRMLRKASIPRSGKQIRPDRRPAAAPPQPTRRARARIAEQRRAATPRCMHRRARRACSERLRARTGVRSPRLSCGDLPRDHLGLAQPRAAAPHRVTWARGDLHAPSRPPAVRAAPTTSPPPRSRDVFRGPRGFESETSRAGPSSRRLRGYRGTTRHAAGHQRVARNTPRPAASPTRRWRSLPDDPLPVFGETT